jgi:hypothetical protein
MAPDEHEQPKFATPSSPLDTTTVMPIAASLIASVLNEFSVDTEFDCVQRQNIHEALAITQAAISALPAR